MTHTHPIPTRRDRAGISLLEVLISVGILSIGLLAALSLLPAGRTYMYKAEIDDRAAALIPVAYETIATQQMLRVSSMSWTPIAEPALTNVEGASAVIRTQGGNPSKVDPNTGYTTAAGWTIEGIDTETITSFYPKNMPPATISGTIPAETPPRTRPVTISSTASVVPNGIDPAGGPNGSTTTLNTGTWSYDIPSSLLPLPAPDMQIETSGPQVGSIITDPLKGGPPYVTYQFTATYADASGTTKSANPTPAFFKQHGRWRAVDHRHGPATTTYGSPSNATATNQDAGSATAISMSALETAQPSSGRGMVPRTVTKAVSDRLWRWTLGTVQNSYEQDVDFANVDDAPPQPRTAVFQNCDITQNAGAFVGGSSTIQDAEDWYSLPVFGDEIIKIQNVSTGGLKPDQTSSKYIPVWFNGTSTPLHPFAAASEPTADYYLIPNDGTILTRAALADATGNTLTGYLGTQLASRDNPKYTFTIERLPSERVVVFDPLMATRMDKVIASDGNGSSNSNYIRRHRFAEFVQVYARSGTTQQRRIPRLNWYPLTQGGDVDTAVAISEFMFRDQDSLVIDQTGDPENAPRPIYDLTATPAPVRRQTAGRMSWLAMLQPVDAGPAALNWTVGKYFNVSLVVFEDRPLPALTSPAYSGEYAFEATWSDVDGMLTVQVPASTGTEDLDDEDVRKLFRTGAWILLAPKVIDDDTSPLEETRQLNWHRIQSYRLQKQPGGGIAAAILLETEPDDLTLRRDLRSTANESRLVVLAYSGVVAVVNRTVQLEQ